MSIGKTLKIDQITFDWNDKICEGKILFLTVHNKLNRLSLDMHFRWLIDLILKISTGVILINELNSRSYVWLFTVLLN